MGETPRSQTVSTQLQRIAERVRQMPEVALTTLAHHIDIEMLSEAYRWTCKDGAVGMDGQTADEYAEQLGVHLASQVVRFQAGTHVCRATGAACDDPQSGRPFDTADRCQRSCNNPQM